VTSVIALRPLVVDDAPFLASLQTDPVFAAHAGWRHVTAIADGEGWWRESIAVPDPLLLRLVAITIDGPVGYVDLHGEDPRLRELGYVIGLRRAGAKGWRQKPRVPASSGGLSDFSSTGSGQKRS
jgi:hypothetical protein